MRAIPALAAFRGLGRAQQGWLLLACLVVVVIGLTAFAISHYDPPPVHPDTFAGIQIARGQLLLDGADLLPGAYATAEVVVSNPSAIAARYSLTARTSTSVGRKLGEALYLVAQTSDGGCGNFDGPILARGPAANFSLGDAIPGDQPGDRRLAPGEREVLCLRVLVAR